jgi:GNAT superfamily N-acetyltransferase
VADVSVRPARPEDVVEIARIQVETWRLAYQGVLPAVVLDAVTVETAESAWSAAVSSPPSPRHRVLVASEQHWVVGFVALAPDEEEGDATVTFGPLLVEPRWGRRGHGSRLLAAAVDHARGDALTRAVMWVPEADRTTQQFLASAGWQPDGLARGLDTGAGELREIRMHVSLAD